jgi:hypothetical protein
MPRPALPLLVLALLGGAVALAQGGLFQDADGRKPPPVTPVEFQRPDPGQSAALMLTIQIDAQGVAVLQATRKPGVGFRLPTDWQTCRFRWTLRDARGAAVAQGGFDPSRICLDPVHAGRPPHMEGDFATPHVTHTNIKVPDVAFATIEFTVEQGGAFIPFGAVRHDTFQVR